MFEKEYMKNLTKLKNKLENQGNRQPFLQDQNWTSSQKSQGQCRKSNKQKYQGKDSKVFDLEQIKKELGLIQLKNSSPEQTQNLANTVEKNNTFQIPSFKKQKQQQVKQESKKRFNRKTSQVMIKQVTPGHESGGFTDRINELVKLRVHHQNIINSLVKKKPSNISTEQENIPLSIKKHQSQSSGYIKVSHQYQVVSPQKSDMQIKKVEKHTNVPPKLEFETGNFNYKSHKNPLIAQDSVDMKQKIIKQTKEKETKNKILSENSYKRSFTQKQILKHKKEQKERPTHTQPQIQSKHQSQDVSRISEISQNLQQADPVNQLNEQKFQMQHHVNLLASLSQFQHTNRQKPQNYESTSNQLHQSILMFIQQNVSRNEKFRNLFSHKKPQIIVMYAGIDQNYYNYHLLIKGLRRSKHVNKQIQKVVEYLTQNQVWQGLFRSQEKKVANQNNKTLIKINEYHGLCFDTGNYVEVLLSETQLHENERAFIMFYISEQSKIYCDISLVLLTRLINLQVNKSFPEMLNRLFGYQFKIFTIEKLIDFTDCMDFIDRLREIHNKEQRNKGGLIVENNDDFNFKQRYSLSQIEEQEQPGEIENISILQDVQKHCDFQLFGFNKTTRIFQLITPYFFSQKNKTVETIQLYEFRELMRHEKHTKRLSQNYNKLSIINKKQLPVKSIHLKHYINHFVVVSINVMEEGLYFLSVGQKIEEVQKARSKENSIKYRLCLISSSTKTILQCLILQRSQSYPVYLPRQEFEVYISVYDAFSSVQNKFLNFTFYIQSHHIIARSTEKMSKRQLQLELRLKEQYQSYTSMIVEQFIEFSFLDKEITRFFSQLHQLNQNKVMVDEIWQSSKAQNGKFQRNDSQKGQNQQMSLQSSEIKSQQSYNFTNNQCNKIQDNYPSEESRVLKLSLDNQNAFQVQQWKIHQDSPVKSQANQRQYLTFDDLQTQPSIKLINILRVHLKALDLYIDCVDTTAIQNKEVGDQQHQAQLTIKYNKPRVLCDSNHNKNVSTIRPDSINLIYLTKDSQIDSVKIQNESSQKKILKIQNQSCEQPIQFKIFRKEW